MEYSWIEIYTLLNLPEMRVLLFGAGKGTEEILLLIDEMGLKLHICGILDNDSSLHGKHLSGYTVYDPKLHDEIEHDLIIVTSVSGKDTIAAQLEHSGLIKGSDFICVGKYPASYLNSIQHILQCQDRTSFLDKRCLHIGPGGFLGLEVYLYALGAEKVFSIDKFSFGFQALDIAQSIDEYLKVREYLILESSNEQMAKERAERFDRVLLKKKSSIQINQDCVTYMHPVDVEELPFADNYFDSIYSFALLEHVDNYKKAIGELLRVTKNGGLNLHTVITEDHRSFSAFDEFHPFSFRMYSESDWRKTVKNRFYQNRVIPCQWREFFGEVGFRILDYTVRERVDVNNYDYDTFESTFKTFSKNELGEIGCTLFLQKKYSNIRK